MGNAGAKSAAQPEKEALASSTPLKQLLDSQAFEAVDFHARRRRSNGRVQMHSVSMVGAAAAAHAAGAPMHGRRIPLEAVTVCSSILGASPSMAKVS